MNDDHGPSSDYRWAQYLSHDPARGVSVHYTVEPATDRWQDGEVVRCLPEDRISGSIDADGPPDQ